MVSSSPQVTYIGQVRERRTVAAASAVIASVIVLAVVKVVVAV